MIIYNNNIIWGIKMLHKMIDRVSLYMLHKQKSKESQYVAPSDLSLINYPNFYPEPLPVNVEFSTNTLDENQFYN